MNINSIKEAEAICGTLSKPSKMPCFSYSIPAKHCLVGQRMRNVKNSICSKCYALKGFYNMPSTVKAMEKRFLSLQNPYWDKAMTFLIGAKEKSGFFRWHDSGDLQSLEHLEDIVQIAKNLPEIKFWLPTREYRIVREYQKKHWPKSYMGSLVARKGFPLNLCVRLSGLMLDGLPPETRHNRHNLPTSGAVAQNWDCPASKQGNKCLDCRLCWNPYHDHVDYKLH